MTSLKRRVGDIGEDIAAQFLGAKGWQILERNWTCSQGELDLIAVDPEGAVVFVEVKCRRGLRFGDPLEAITYAKLRKLKQLAGIWLSEQSRGVRRVRIDAVGVLLGGAQPEVTHAVGITQ